VFDPAEQTSVILGANMSVADLQDIKVSNSASLGRGFCVGLKRIRRVGARLS